MSKAGIASIALFGPIVASNAVFSARRASRGIDAIDENPLFALTNFDIAAAQVLKGGRAAKALAITADPTLNIATKGAAETIKSTSMAGKVLKGAGKVVKFTADHINPVIIGGGIIKTLGSEDKLDTGAKESTALLCMFGAEGAMKKFVGMPITEKVNGKIVTKSRDGAYKKLFKAEQLKAMKDFFAVEKTMAECTNLQKVLKVVPGATKGLLFVGASIAGYSIGQKIAETILGESKQSA